MQRSPGTTSPSSAVGAPRLSFEPPPPTSAAGRFLAWLEANRSAAEGMVRRLRHQHRLPTGFVAVNFSHRELGSAGSAVVAVLDPELIIPSERFARLMSIPYAEFGDAAVRWRSGELVLVGFEAMSPALQLRFAPTPLRWSLNVPLHVAEQWVGIVGANSISSPPSELAVRGFGALAETLAAEFEASRAHSRFLGEIDRRGVKR